MKFILDFSSVWISIWTDFENDVGDSDTINKAFTILWERQYLTITRPVFEPIESWVQEHVFT